VVAYFLSHPEMRYKIASLCGHINDAEVYSLFSDISNGEYVFVGVEKTRDKLAVNGSEFNSVSIEKLSKKDHSEMVTLIKDSFGDSCDENKLYCQNITSAVYKKVGGKLVSCCLVDRERLYSIAAINGVEWSLMIKELVNNNYDVWMTADCSNKKILALCLISGLKVETDPLVLKKILKSKYANYSDEIDIYYFGGLLVFKKNNPKSYPQVLLRS
jgi:predicted ribosome-associated RNA-binding protein Tma20